MKKRLLCTIFTAMAAATLFAERTFISGTGFEGIVRTGTTNQTPMYAEGPINLLKYTEDAAYYWKSTDGTEDSAGAGCATVMAYGSQARPGDVDMPDASWDETSGIWATNYYATGTANTKYLEVDSGATLLARSIVPGDPDDDEAKKRGAIGDDGIYIDSMVQFTVADQATPPVVNSDDKLIVWLCDNVDAETGVSTTNLMIMAGAYIDGYYVTNMTYTIPTDCVAVAEDEWHRLTIVAEMYAYIKGQTADTDRSTARFKVYIDGKQLEADDGTSAFLSMIASGKSDQYDKIYWIGFTGRGCVEDIVFATDTPFERAPINYRVIPGEGIASFDYQIKDSSGDVIYSESGVVGTLVISNSTYNRKIVEVTGINYETGYLEDPDSQMSGTISEDGSFTITAKTLAFTVVADDATSTHATMASVTNAIASAAKATITLNEDYTLASGESLRVPKNAAVTLDLNGHKLESNDSGNNIIVVNQNGSSLLLKDSVGNGVVKYADGLTVDTSRRFVISNSRTLTIGESRADTFMLCSAKVYSSGSNSSLTINGGMFEFLPRNSKGDITDYKGICPRGWTLGKAAESDEYYTLQPNGEDETEEVSADDVAATQYATEAEAAAAAEAIVIVAPNAASLTADEKTAYSEYVVARVVASGDKYVINAVFSDAKVEELQQAADDGAAAVLAAVDGGQVVVDPAVPGLYYTLEHGTTLPLADADTTLAGTGQTQVTFTIEKDAAQGFYRIKISPTAQQTDAQQ